MCRKYPTDQDKRNTKLTNLVTELEPELTAAQLPSGSSVKHMAVVSLMVRSN